MHTADHLSVPLPLQDFPLPLTGALAASSPILWHLNLIRPWLSTGALATPQQVDGVVASRRKLDDCGISTL